MHKYFVVTLSVFAGLTLGCSNSGDRWISSGLNGGQKARLLAAHNEVRNKVASGGAPGQPRAQNIRELHWDDSLAQGAQKWADTCVFAHDPHRVYPGGGYVGQNLYKISYSGYNYKENVTYVDNGNVDDGVWAWYNEVRLYRFQPVSWSNFHATGHYSQEVWADTSKVGCGLTIFQNGGWRNHYLVCNYYHGGNIIGQYPYVAGSPNCGRFRMKPSGNYRYLCN